MLLALDIGNTAMKFGLFDGDSLVSKFALPTRRDYTQDEISKAISTHLSDSPDAVIFSSVVPELDRMISETFQGKTLRQVTGSDDFGLSFHFSIDKTGTDRLVNSFAAAGLYGTPCIVVSFGTATTIDVVNKDREYLGGLIAPGAKASSKALELVTAKLPEVEIHEPLNVIGKTTEDAIRSGIFYGQIGLVEAAIPRIKAEIGEEAKVIVTGGYASLVADKCPVIDHIEPDLTLLGLKVLYSRA